MTTFKIIADDNVNVDNDVNLNGDYKFLLRSSSSLHWLTSSSGLMMQDLKHLVVIANVSHGVGADLLSLQHWTISIYPICFSSTFDGAGETDTGNTCLNSDGSVTK